MRTKIYTTALITLTIILGSINLNATTFTFEDEAFINDIPFDTELVCEQILIEETLNLFQFEEEEYIDDIPFNTSEIAASTKNNEIEEMTFTFEEEAYINDIPFNTQKIATASQYAAAVNVDFQFEEENYVDDIPFNTSAIANEYGKEVVSSKFMIASALNILF